MSKLSDFNALMLRKNIPQHDKTALGLAGLATTPVSDRLFCGTDVGGRAFVNIPVTDCDHTGHVMDGVIVVYRLYRNHNDLFMATTHRLMVSATALLGGRLGDFSRLEALLSGETVRFYGQDCVIDCVTRADLTRWVDVQLDARVVQRPAVTGVTG